MEQVSKVPLPKRRIPARLLLGQPAKQAAAKPKRGSTACRRKRPKGEFPAVPNGTILLPTHLNNEIKNKLQTIRGWFTTQNLRDIVIPLIKRQQPPIDTVEGDKISMRQISWALVGFSKAKRELCNYNWVHPFTGKPVELNVQEVYNIITENNTRELIAPHRRSGELQIKLDDAVIPTTFAQIHYIYQASIWGVVDWVIKHKKMVRDHMNSCQERNRQAKAIAEALGQTFKRRALCSASTAPVGMQARDLSETEMAEVKEFCEKQKEVQTQREEAKALNLDAESFWDVFGDDGDI